MVLRVPVVLILFNRPGPTRRVMERVAAARPQRLFLVADGPRAPEDAEPCAAARAAAEAAVDWDCEVVRDYAAANLRTRGRIPSGLSRVFEQTDRAIILEDDVLPDPSFFPYCEELLQRYEGDERVAAISGCSFIDDRPTTRDSYYFSRYPQTWGWATWRRAWERYDPDLRRWPEARGTPWLEELLEDAAAARYWRGIFDAVYERRITCWDYQWLFACWRAGALGVQPRVNLVTNIGFGPGATHTLRPIPGVTARPAHRMDSPLRHPAEVAWSRGLAAREFAATYDTDGTFRHPGLYGRLRRRLRLLRQAARGIPPQ